jgi:N-acetylneuraminic acid mutarotase
MNTILCLCTVAIQALSTVWMEAPPLPIPITNNAVAGMPTSDGPAVFSFLGLDSTKRWDGITNRAFRWDLGEPAWKEIDPVPGPGRLAATAQVVRGEIYVFSGYTVAEDGRERTLPDVAIFNPGTGRWRQGSPILEPVDDAVSGIWRDSLIYLISGWQDRDNVRDVQIYDPATDSWQQATPIPGTPVFGHAGGVVGDVIVYLDGVRRNAGGQPRYEIVTESWQGQIDENSPTKISWSRLPNHPGPPLYRAAATAVDGWVLFAGGTDNPYNYDGLGYDGVPSHPLDGVFGWNAQTGSWHSLPRLTTPSMDHRGIVALPGQLVIVGGMVAAQRVTPGVAVAPLNAVVGNE